MLKANEEILKHLRTTKFPNEQRPWPHTRSVMPLNGTNKTHSAYHSPSIHTGERTALITTIKQANKNKLNSEPTQTLFTPVRTVMQHFKEKASPKQWNLQTLFPTRSPWL